MRRVTKAETGAWSRITAMAFAVKYAATARLSTVSARNSGSAEKSCA